MVYDNAHSLSYTILPKNQSVDFINSAGGNVANNIEEFATRGYNGQKYGVSHIRDTWDLQPWSRLKGNIIEDKIIRPLSLSSSSRTAFSFDYI